MGGKAQTGGGKRGFTAGVACAYNGNIKFLHAVLLKSQPGFKPARRQTIRNRPQGRKGIDQAFCQKQGNPLTGKQLFGYISSFYTACLPRSRPAGAGIFAEISHSEYRGPQPHFSKDSIMSKGKGTFQPGRTSRSRTHGFLVRMRTRSGQSVIRRRRAKGRKQLAP